MQKQFLIISAILLISIFSAFSIKSFYTAKDTNPIVFKKGSTYGTEWNRVDSLESKGLPQSALELAEQIYTKAKADTNIPQIVKSLMYQIKITNYVEEEGLVKAIERIEKETQTAITPVKQILHSVSADLYFKYFQKNRWKIFQRTSLEDNTSRDIRTWDAKKLSKKIIEEYQASLSENDSLQRISIATIEPLIVSQGTKYQRSWPTIYDFVAYRAINAFSNDMLGITKAIDEFNLDDSKYFLPTEKFINIKISTKDSLSLKFQAVKALQTLVKFHTELENPDALIDVEIYRLNLIYKNSKNNEKDKFYLEALERLLKQFKNVPHSTYIRYQIADLAQKKAAKLVSNLEETETFKKFNEKALEQIQVLTTSKADSILIAKSKYLLSLIKKPSLSMVTEEVALPNESFPINITARNIHNIKLKAYKIDYAKYDAITKKRLYGEELFSKIIGEAKEVSTRDIAIDQLNDYQQHSADLIMPKLPKGLYIISIEGDSEKGLNVSKNFSMLKVSALSYMQRNNSGNLEIWVLDRKTGMSLPNVNVQLWYKEYSYDQRRSLKKSAGLFKTDKNGLVTKQISDQKNVYVEVYNKDDRFSSERSMYSYREGDARDRFKTHFFTDRAIYRPGQTVYFKAISLGENGDKKWLLKEEDLTVTMQDVNYQKVSSLKLKTNEFGSVSGNFVIPTGVLTGRMQLKSKHGNISINVEEYKRPRFEVRLDAFTGNYKLNENISISGTAVGFAGENITDAKFKYRVVRKPNYSYYWRYSPSRGQETEIASGEGITNEKGTFEFEFLAKANNLKENEEASYNYQIYVDVIDITGETHSDEGGINVGTTALTLSMNIPENVNVNQLDSFKLSAQNLNGEEIPTQVELELHKVKYEVKVKNNRLWAEPDVILDSEEDWAENLPNYVYLKKDLKNQSFKLMHTSSINSKADSYWKVDKKLKEGYYKISMKAKGPFGKEIVKEQFFTVLNENSKNMPKVDKNLFSVLTKTVEPGENAELLIGSSFENIKVLLEIDKKDRPIEKRWIKLNNSKQKISIQVTEADRGNFTVRLSFIYENRVYQKSARIAVPHTDKQLDLAFETFRNKLYPGQKEEWRVKIKGHKGEAAAAEFLAAMYDASLDEFATQAWNFNILNYYSGKQKYAAQGFGTRSAQSIFNAYKHQGNPSFSKPYFNWFGFGSSGRHYTRKVYSQASGTTFEKDTSIVKNDKTKIGAIRGEVLDLETGEAIPFANVSISSSSLSKTGAMTDFNGKYRIDSIPEGSYTIEASYMGYKSAVLSDLHVKASMASVQNFALASSVSKLSEVQVVSRKASMSFAGEVLEDVEQSVELEEEVESADEDDADKEQTIQSPKEKGRLTLKVRKNFDETAFFYPQLKTNEEGDVVFSFTMPESLTKWNFKGFAHTTDLKYGFINEEIVTQKDLMVMPNAPRFFREGDKMELPVKVSNLSKATQNVNATVRFYNALTGKEITNEIYPTYKSHKLEIEVGQSGVFSAELQIPEGYQSISYKVIASTGSFADGEEKAIPVLTNRMLVTESLPLPIRGKGTKTFKFEKLIKNKSKTLKHYNYTLEMTSNPAWYAVQALPYLAENLNDCAEQTFSRFYANALASHIANSSPKISKVFDAWRNAPKSETLLSNLDKNKELKAALLEETPWVMDAQSETEQRRRVAMLFDLNQLAYSQKSSLRKLKEMQSGSGAWPWFKGMRENRYITQLIVSGLGHLRKLNVLDLKKDYETLNMIKKGIGYLDGQVANDYNYLKTHHDDKELKKESYVSSNHIQYLYMRSFFNDIVPVPEKSKAAIAYFTQNSQTYWINHSQYLQAMIALSALREPKTKSGIHVENQILASLKENALHSEEMGMYWKSKSGYYWHEAPIEKQALMIELFSEIGDEQTAVEDLKVWLLKQKQTQSWKTTRATSDAIYALLMNGTDLLANDELVQVTLGGKKVDPSKNSPIEAGTGYFKTSWNAEEIKPEMGEITLKKNDEGVAWGAVYWQYFEDLDKITAHKTPLHIEKELFIEKNTKTGPELTSIDKTEIKVGDKIIVRIVLRVDRAMEYVHLKDMRASGFEPLNVMSGYRWKNGLGYYESTKDASTNFFFDYVKKGTYVFEYPVRAVHQGEFSNGISNIQCMYAPEFTSHSEGIRVNISK